MSAGCSNATTRKQQKAAESPQGICWADVSVHKGTTNSPVEAASPRLSIASLLMNVSGFMSSLRPSAWWATVLGVALLLGTGCSSSSFVGRQYDNFTAYYNAFYNANKAFEKGVEATASQRHEALDLSRYVMVFERPESTGQNQDLEEAIEKSAGILRDHPTSKWTDDALMLIGKSYFYQQNNVGAERKFREVIDLGSDMEGEARFWLARTLFASNRLSEAAEALQNGLEAERDFEAWTDRMHLLQGQLHVQRKQWEDAAAALRAGLDDSDVPDDVDARAALLLGQVYETLNRPDLAEQAYDRAGDAPRYELSYAGTVSALRVRGLGGQADDALKDLRSLRRDDKNNDRRAQLRLLQARVEWADQRPHDARQTLRSVLYDDPDEQPRGVVRGRIHYTLGRLYRDAWNDFQKAAAHFDTAATDLEAIGPQQDTGGLQPPPSPEAITDGQQQAERYASLADASRRVARLDSLLRLGRMPRDEFQAFIAELQQKRAEEEAARREAQAQRASAQRFAARSTSMRRGGRSTTGSTTAGGGTAGFLFYKDPARVQEGRRSFERVWGDRPRTENWRRLTALSGGRTQRNETASADTAATTPTAEPAPDADRDGAAASPSASRIDVSAVPRTSDAQDEMEAERAVARYELASALFLAAERPDSAATWYQRVMRQSGDQPVARRAMYALAEVRAAQEQDDEARQLYRRIIQEAPQSAFAKRAQQQLGDTVTETTDMNVRADSAYAVAYRLWDEQDWASALEHLQAVIASYPETSAAPRSLLAAVQVAGEWRRYDSTATVAASLQSFLNALPKDMQPSTSSTDEAPASSSSASSSPAPTDTEAPAHDPSKRVQETPPRRTQPTRTPADSIQQAAPPSRRPSPAVESDTSHSQDPKRAAPSRDSVQAPSALQRASASSVDSLNTPAPAVQDPSPLPDQRQAAPDSSAGSSALHGAEGAKQATASGEREETSVRHLMQTLLSVLAEHYPDAPQAAYAVAMKEAWQTPPPSAEEAEEETKKPIDETTSEGASPFKEEGEAPKRIRRPSRPSMGGRPTPQATPSASDSAAVDTSALPQQRQSRPSRPAAPDTARTLWTLQVMDEYASRAPADSQASALRGQLQGRFPVNTRQEKQSYRITIGRFDHQQAARDARKRLQRMMDVRVRVRSLSSAPPQR